jgi:hypothetical protein
VQDILNTPAWTDQDCLPAPVAQHSRVRHLEVQLVRRRLVCRTPGVNRVNGLDDSAFWFCASKALQHAGLCLTLHDHPINEGTPGLLAGTMVFDWIVWRPEDTENQVEIAFHVVTLLYATFMIPVPPRDSTPLWTAMITRDNQVQYRPPGSTGTMPTLECLTLTPDPAIHDRHNMKQSLRLGEFGTIELHQNVELLPWLDVLRELVGYTKYVQSLRPAPAFTALEEMSRLCALETARLAPLLRGLDDDRNYRAVTALMNSRTPPTHPPHPPGGAEPDPHTASARLPRLLSRMHAVIKT